MRISQPYLLCLTCKNNDNGICKLTGKDMYENRMLPVKYGGCGEIAIKWQGVAEKHDSGEVRVPYGWS